jgi:hypothetical protein
MPERTYRNGERVEVCPPNQEVWVRAMVFGFAKRDGAWKYYVQRSGSYPACDVNDAACWYPEDGIRAA